MNVAGLMTARRFAALGAVMIACGIGLLAVASHAGDAVFRPALSSGAVLLANGLGLLALHSAHGLRYARWPIALGALLFAASVLLAASLGLRAQTAPLGGMVMMLGWLVAAGELLRAPESRAN